jgi:hypothetical protein
METQKTPLKKIKRTLTNAPALGLPDVMKPFFLYVHESLGTAIGVLTQLLVPGITWWPTYQSNLMQFPKVGHPACAPWRPLLSWWLKQTNLLWDKTSQSEFPTLF